MTQKPVPKTTLTKYKYPLIVVAVAAIALLIGGAIALSFIPAPEHITGTPLPIATPTPTTTPSPTPTPTITLQLTSNNTTPFYLGDTLRMTAQLSPVQAGITITLTNNGAVITTASTDATGKAIFDRSPTLPFDYTATATIP